MSAPGGAPFAEFDSDANAALELDESNTNVGDAAEEPSNGCNLPVSPMPVVIAWSGVEGAEVSSAEMDLGLDITPVKDGPLTVTMTAIVDVDAQEFQIDLPEITVEAVAESLELDLSPLSQPIEAAKFSGHVRIEASVTQNGRVTPVTVPELFFHVDGAGDLVAYDRDWRTEHYGGGDVHGLADTSNVPPDSYLRSVTAAHVEVFEGDVPMGEGEA